MNDIELALIQEMEQEAFRNVYETACKLVVERLEQIQSQVSEQKERNYIKMSDKIASHSN